MRARGGARVDALLDSACPVRPLFRCRTKRQSAVHPFAQRTSNIRAKLGGRVGRCVEESESRSRKRKSRRNGTPSLEILHAGRSRLGSTRLRGPGHGAQRAEPASRRPGCPLIPRRLLNALDTKGAVGDSWLVVLEIEGRLQLCIAARVRCNSQR